MQACKFPRPACSLYVVLGGSSWSPFPQESIVVNDSASAHGRFDGGLLTKDNDRRARAGVEARPGAAVVHLTLEQGHSLLTMPAVAAAALVLAALAYRRVFGRVIPARWRLL